MDKGHDRRCGLVLVGGGARAAYQAGVLCGVSEVLGPRVDGPAFDVISGISAGAINGAYLAAGADRMREAIQGLYRLWHEIDTHQIIRTDVPSLARIGGRWIRDLSLGGIMPGSVRSNYFLDTAPLSRFLADKIDFGAISANLEKGILHGFAVSATNYRTGTAISFYDGSPRIAPWVRSARLGKRTRIALEHVLASASLPIFFRPVPIEGSFYGDGGIRMNTPISPVIHMGAGKVMAISIRYLRSGDQTSRLNEPSDGREVSIADIAGTMMNAAFLDGLDSDAERMERINQTLALMNEEQRSRNPNGLRPIPLLVLRPSTDLGALASEQFHKFPRALRYLLKGVGASEERGWDFLSYLAFDPSYTRVLLDLGRSDALAQRDRIEEFFV